MASAHPGQPGPVLGAGPARRVWPRAERATAVGAETRAAVSPLPGRGPHTHSARQSNVFHAPIYGPAALSHPHGARARWARLIFYESVGIRPPRPAPSRPEKRPGETAMRCGAVRYPGPVRPTRVAYLAGRGRMLVDAMDVHPGWPRGRAVGWVGKSGNHPRPQPPTDEALRHCCGPRAGGPGRTAQLLAGAHWRPLAPQLVSVSARALAAGLAVAWHPSVVSTRSFYPPGPGGARPRETERDRAAALGVEFASRAWGALWAVAGVL